MRDHNQILLKIWWSGSGSKCQVTPCAGALCFPPYREVSDLRQFANPGWTEEPPAQKTEHSIWLDSCGATSLWLCFCLQAGPLFFSLFSPSLSLVLMLFLSERQQCEQPSAGGGVKRAMNDLSSLGEPRLCLTLLEEKPRSWWSGAVCVSQTQVFRTFSSFWFSLLLKSDAQLSSVLLLPARSWY